MDSVADWKVVWTTVPKGMSSKSLLGEISVSGVILNKIQVIASHKGSRFFIQILFTCS